MEIPSKITEDQWTDTMASDMCAIANPYPKLLKHLIEFNTSTDGTAKDIFNKFVMESADHLSKDDMAILSLLSLLKNGNTPEMIAGIIHWIVQKLTSK